MVQYPKEKWNYFLFSAGRNLQQKQTWERPIHLNGDKTGETRENTIETTTEREDKEEKDKIIGGMT